MAGTEATWRIGFLREDGPASARYDWTYRNRLGRLPSPPLESHCWLQNLLRSVAADGLPIAMSQQSVITTQSTRRSAHLRTLGGWEAELVDRDTRRFVIAKHGR